MSGLQDYLVQKREALLARRESVSSNPDAGPVTLTATAAAEGRSGIRRIRIRQHQIISDSPPDFAGYDLGPSSPEIQLGVLGSCLTHIFLIQAADRQVPLDAIDVEITADIDPRAGRPGFESIPIYPHNIGYRVEVTSPASGEEIAELHQAVKAVCPIYNLLVNPQTIAGELVHHQVVEPTAVLATH